MKKISVFLFLLLFPNLVLATDCCKNHNGNSGTCSLDSTIVCNDGFVCTDPCIITGPVPSIEKEEKKEGKTDEIRKGIPKIYGCTDKSAKNYNKNATASDNSCIYYRYGCMDKAALNYDETAEKDDGSCISKVYGCTDENARNYNEKANVNDHKCEYVLIREVDEEIPFKVQIKKDKKMDLYEEEIIQKGITGRMKVKYEIILNGDGKEISKKVLEKTVLRDMQDKIIVEGSNNSIFDQMFFLYEVALVCLFINFIMIRNSTNFYLLSFLFSMNFLKKLILLPLYFFFILPVFIDFFLIIKNEIEKRI